jgi:hypothetical protein
MALFGRRGGAEEKPVGAEELRHSVDEGFLIAKSALTVAVANRIILDALQEHETFDEARVAEAVRAELSRLAEEQRQEAERMRQTHAKAQTQKGRSRHQHDYRRGDDLALRTREASYTELARRLDASREDGDFINRVILRARQRAWDDIGGTVIDRLGWAQRPTADYEVGRDERLQLMLDEDFAALLRERGDYVPDDGDREPTGQNSSDKARRTKD